jgi:sugar phosphate isomerase/epimerase
MGPPDDGPAPDPDPDPGAAGIDVGMSLDHTADTLQELGPALDLFETLGVDSVELFLPSLGVVVGAGVRAGQLAELRRLCADRPFAITAHGALSVNLGDVESKRLQRDVVRASVDACGAAGIRLLVQHAMHCPFERRAIDLALGCEREALAALGPEAAAAGVVLAIETMYPDPGRWTPSPAELAAQLGAVDAPAVGATVDFGHSWLNRGHRPFDYLAEMAELAPWAAHLHIHDNFGRPALFRPWSRGDAIMLGFGDLHLPPGAGDVPWDALARLPWRGRMTANLELDKRWMPEWRGAIGWARDWAARAAGSPRPRGAV